MKTLEVSAKIGKTGTPVSVNFQMPENLAEMSTTFGEDVVYNHVKSSITVALQSFMRSKIDPAREGGPMSKADLQAEISGDGTEDAPGWKPGTRNPGKSAADKVKEQFGKMSPEDRAALLASLQAGDLDTDAEVDETDEAVEGEDQTEQVEEVQKPVQQPVTQRGARRR